MSMLLAAAPAQAVEVGWSGHYRARGLLYDSLSLSRTNDLAEGTSNLIDHRFRLIPSFFVTPNVAMFAQLDFLPLATWGDQPATWYDPVSETAIPLAYADGVTNYVDAEDAGSYARNLMVTRAYADIYTGIGRFRFGRVPFHWGSGILFNSGLDVLSEYGDTSDRLQLTTRLGSVYLMTGWEVMFEGDLGVPDDMQAADLAIAYRTETLGIGLLNRFRYQPSLAFKAYTGDFWSVLELGPARVEAEVAAVFGGGDFDTGLNDIGIAAVGAMLRAEITLDRLYGGLEGGVATGDEDPDDAKIRTFTFDRDHNVALMMFEEPMPTLEAAVINETNAGREYGATRTGDGISNALYLRPHVGFKFLPQLRADVALFTARAAKLPESQAGQTGYGNEVDLNIRYDPYEHFWLQGTFGVFLPGTYYSNYTHDELGGDFGAATYGGRLMGTVEF